MKRNVLIILFLMFFVGPGLCQDSKLSDLPDLGTKPSTSDELYINDGGVSKKVTYSDLMSLGTITESDLSGVNWIAHDEYGVLRDDWTTHEDYPVQCDLGEYVVGLGDELICEPAIAYSPWGESSGVVSLHTTTNDAVVGSATPADGAKFSIVGDAVQKQFVVRGNATQTDNLIEAQQSDGTTVFSVDNDGGTAFGDGIVGGSVRMKESAAPPGIISADYGQYWVDASKLPRFTDGDGINWTLLTEDTVVESINWTTIDELVLDGINWTTYFGGGADINWAEITELDLTGINWADYQNLAINWPEIDESVLTGINWEYYSGGADINWTTITELVLNGINWDDYENVAINWAEITELDLVGINWDSYLGGGEDINWSEITELDLDGINWTYYANGGGINWTTINTTKLDGINWVDLEGGYTNLTEFVNQTAWRVFYSNASGDVTELALGGDGSYLRSNGASSAPTFDTPSAGSANYRFIIRPNEAKLPTTNMMASEGGLYYWAGLFDASTDECATWEDVLYPYTGTLKVKLQLSSATATSGDVVMTIATACITPGDAGAVGAKAFGTADSMTGTVPATTADRLFEVSDASLNGDSCAAWDKIMFRICRDADNAADTATGDIRLRSGIVYAE